MKPHVISHMMESVDGRKGMASVFDGIDAPDRPATLLKLKSLERMGYTVWLRYTLK